MEETTLIDTDGWTVNDYWRALGINPSHVHYYFSGINNLGTAWDPGLQDVHASRGYGPMPSEGDVVLAWEGNNNSSRSWFVPAEHAAEVPAIVREALGQINLGSFYVHELFARVQALRDNFWILLQEGSIEAGWTPVSRWQVPPAVGDEYRPAGWSHPCRVVAVRPPTPDA
jgi:hypothetical protein